MSTLIAHCTSLVSALKACDQDFGHLESALGDELTSNVSSLLSANPTKVSSTGELFTQIGEELKSIRTWLLLRSLNASRDLASEAMVYAEDDQTLVTLTQEQRLVSPRDRVEKHLGDAIDQFNLVVDANVAVTDSTQ